MTGKKVAVELRDVSKNVLDTVPITLSEGRQQAVFSWHAKEVGATVLTISVVPEPEETIHENNSIDFPVEVSSRKSKVLVIDGVPRWDLRFLDHAIRRDTGFEATIVLANGFEEEVIDGEILPPWALQVRVRSKEFLRMLTNGRHTIWSFSAM